MTGWISIDRSIQNHWLFKEKRTFSKFEAWIYLLMEANHSKAKVPIGNQIVTVERGQRLTSILTLSDLFNWSRFKVKTFLDLLESDGMLEVKTTSKYTLITIVNYDFYQSEQGRNQHQNDIKPTSKQHQSNINPTSKQHQTNTNNNDNKDNNEKNVNNEKKKTTAFDFFQDNGFGFITSYNLDDLNYYLDSFENDSDEIVTASLKIAKDRNKVTWGYAKSILNTWLNANLKSIEQVRAFEKQQLESKKQNYKPFVKQSKEKTPKWLTDSTRETKTPEMKTLRKTEKLLLSV
ncbi:DnaD domain-containing protein [Staphylococcus aureus]|nr:DnaD domain-containing protein [Staphylococcus aureus]MBU8370118.1 DnaD domain-containing protein [Staphylococcus aureus]MBX8453632.1 DnaD domain-containing protein [Staphylococcus aureus]CUD09373.1 Phage protein [Staphylococcus aureus]CUD27476.1 Phage protein [Staphylococcus aureus]